MAKELQKGKVLQVEMTQKLKTYFGEGGQPNEYYEYTVEIDGEKVVFYRSSGMRGSGGMLCVGRYSLGYSERLV